MNDQRVKTDNEVIAEFMGIQVYQDHAEMQAVPIDKLSIWMYADQTKRYETEWKYLMEVVEKIEAMDNKSYGFTIDPWTMVIVEYASGNEEEIASFQNDDDYPKMQQYHHCILQFIHWYQKQKSS